MKDTLPVSRPPKSFPTVLKSLLWVAVFFLMQILVTVLALIVSAITNPKMIEQLNNMGASPKEEDVLNLLAVPTLWGLVFSGIITLGLLYLNLRKEDRMSRIGLIWDKNPPSVQLVGLGIGLITLTYGLNFLYSTYVIPGVDMQGGMVAFLDGIPKTPLHSIGKFLAVGVLAAVLEEILFRGYLQNALQKHMPAWAAIVLASLAFGAMHFQPYALPALAVMGSVFGYIYHRTGSLYTNIALHAANNTLALAFM
jgi:membrane protease YdiL (CAAX protease family)